MSTKQLSKRQLQIGEEIRRHTAIELNELVNTRIDGDFLTIMKAETSKDLRYAKIFFRCKIENREKYEELLNSVAVDISKILYKKLHLRVLPNITFIFDDTLLAIDEINRVVKENS